VIYEVVSEISGKIVRVKRRAPGAHVLVFVCPTILAISGEAHRVGRGYHVGRILEMYRGSELSVAGFVRIIAGLGCATTTTSGQEFCPSVVEAQEFLAARSEENPDRNHQARSSAP
jgi:hypothetical protein